MSGQQQQEQISQLCFCSSPACSDCCSLLCWYSPCLCNLLSPSLPETNFPVSRLITQLSVRVSVCSVRAPQPGSNLYLNSFSTLGFLRPGATAARQRGEAGRGKKSELPDPSFKEDTISDVTWQLSFYFYRGAKGVVLVSFINRILLICHLCCIFKTFTFMREVSKRFWKIGVTWEQSKTCPHSFSHNCLVKVWPLRLYLPQCKYDICAA